MNEEEKITRNAVSIYGQGDEALNDFPVLKAFQQYIDAEQTKARKRLILLCSFFGFLMLVVITVFIVVLSNVNARNQLLSDKLFDLAMKDRDRQPDYERITSDVTRQISVQQASNDSAFKALTETLTMLGTQMAAQKAKSDEMVEQLSRKPEGATREQLALQHRLDEESENLRKFKALLKTEQEKLAAEKERLHQQEIEIQRRRLYPEYYAQQERKQTIPVAKPKPQKPASPSVPINYFDAYEDDDEEDIDEELSDMVKALPVKKTTKTAPVKSTPKAHSSHFGVPIEVNGKTTDWLVPTK